MSNQTLSTKVVTGVVRLSYVNVAEPRPGLDGGEPKYSVLLMIPKSDKDTLQKMATAISNAAEIAKTSKFGGKIPVTLKSTLKDADKDTNMDGEVLSEKNPEFKDHFVISVSSKTQPTIVDGRMMPIEPAKIYSGCYARVSLRCFGYNTNGNKGISAGLNHIQFVKHGEPLGSVTRPEDDFQELEEFEEV